MTVALRPLGLALTLALTLGAPACKPRSSPTSDSGARDSGAAVAAAPTGLPAPPDVAEVPVDAVKTPSGLATKVLTPGTGTEHPAVNDTVKVDYSGWTTDGKMFDSSVAPLQKGKKAAPITLSLSHVIPGWTEGMQLMVVGEKRRLWIPQELAYNGKPGAPAGMLVFDVELFDHAGPEAAGELRRTDAGRPDDEGRAREQGPLAGHGKGPSDRQ